MATVQLGTAYGFSPTASDADGDALFFSIVGKPDWATFSTANGSLTGLPASAGLFANISITVSDGEATRTLGPFSITVTAPVQTLGSATLRWAAPAQYTDGSAFPATELASYRVYHGTDPARLARVAEVDKAATLFTLGALGSGTHYFAVTAVSSSDMESAFSAVGSKTIL